MNADEQNTNLVVPQMPSLPRPEQGEAAGLDSESCSFADRKVRQKLRDELRAEEWAMHRELMAAARVTLKNFYENPHKTTVADLVRLVDLASKLGRLATETGGDLEMIEDGGAVMIEFHAALRKVYARRESEGRPLPKNVIIEAVTVGGEAASASRAEGQTSEPDGGGGE